MKTDPPVRCRLVAGVPRSGKSTLARRLSAECGLSQVPMDSVVSALASAHPELGITHYGEHAAVCRAFAPFLEALLVQLESERSAFVADVYHLTPRDAADRGLSERCETVFLGYPTAEPEVLSRRIRAVDGPDDWTAALSAPDLDRLAARFIEESRVLEADCRRLGLRFVDTGSDHPAALDAAFALLDPR